MANEKNLRPKDSNQSRDEAKKNGKKGGIASGEARRKKKTMRELLEIAMSEVVENRRTGEKKTRDEWVAAALAQKAMKGDVSAYKAIADMRGESAPLKIDANVKQAQTTQISFAGMDVDAMATFLTDVKEQAQRQHEELADE